MKSLITPLAALLCLPAATALADARLVQATGMVPGEWDCRYLQVCPGAIIDEDGMPAPSNDPPELLDVRVMTLEAIDGEASALPSVELVGGFSWSLNATTDLQGNSTITFSVGGNF